MLLFRKNINGGVDTVNIVNIRYLHLNGECYIVHVRVILMVALLRY